MKRERWPVPHDEAMDALKALGDDSPLSAARAKVLQNLRERFREARPAPSARAAKPASCGCAAHDHLSGRLEGECSRPC